MFIQTEATPNPNTMKFIPGAAVTGGEGLEFKTRKDAEGLSPLAERLFDIEGVASVYLGSDFVAVTKSESEDWTAVRTLVLGIMFEFFTMNKPVLSAPVSGVGRTGEPSRSYSAEEKILVDKIIELLNSRVRPAVARDGGDIEFVEFDKGILWLRMRGACSGCPSSTMTLKMGIENMMRHYVPEVLEVRAVNDE